ncbi:MAG: hypothetical protein PHR35_00820, partial [Kiritimatiellae bacterium]|nr:hypothetical protein [Kiritimatiellia bacterium]
PPLEIHPGMDREAIRARLETIRAENTVADLAFYAWRDLSLTEARPFLLAAMQRSPVVLTATANLGESECVARLRALPSESIYDGAGRCAQPDEVWTFQRGDGVERLLALAVVLRERRRDPRLTIAIKGQQALLLDADGATLCALPTAKQPRETLWCLDDIPLRG